MLEERQLLSTITVNSTADETAADSTLSLREAIEVSNGTLAVASLSTQEQAQVSGAVGSTNTIDFNIPKSDPGYDAATGVWTIALKSGLPAISTNAAIIDGYSQPGASPNTLAQGDNAVLKIAVSGANAGNTSGVTIAQPGSKLRGVDIEDFGGNGDAVLITAAGNAQVAGCFIGIDPSGEKAAPNYDGMVIQNSSNLIGGPNVADRNVISGNSLDGINVPDKAGNPLGIEPTGNVIENNYIGIDAAGTKAVGNFGHGVYDYGSGNTYGGTTAGLGNVISGNGDGIFAGGSIRIEGNLVGTDPTGTTALGNQAYAIFTEQDLSGAPVLSVNITKNVVSGNPGYAIYLNASSQPSQATYTIANNLIGTNAAGTAALGNAGVGLTLAGVDNASIKDNVISANEIGLQLSGSVAVVQGNMIGTDKTGHVALGNTQGGILVTNSTGSIIGGTGPGEGNVIADNNGPAIEIDEGQQNRITQNSIYGNTGVGIFLGPFVTHAVPAPVLSFTPGTGPTGTLSGTLKATPNTAYTVEIFSDPGGITATSGQGQTFVQDVTLNTDGTGKGSFSVAEPVGYYAVTATDPSGNTSPFSTIVGSQSLATSQTAVSSLSNPSTAGQPVTFTAVVTASGYQGTPTGTVTFSIDGQPQSPVQLSVIGGVDEAQFVATTLTAGSYSVSASYSGDAHVGSSSGSLPTQTISPASLQPTTTLLTSSLNPSTPGQQVTFTAVVTAPSYHGTPTGTVTFTIDGQAQTPVPLALVGTSDEAVFTTSTLSAGSHTVSASYSGDSHVSSSTGSLPTQTVTAPGLHATTTTLTSSPSPSTAGQPVTFTAIVSPDGSPGSPSGSVTFTIDGVSQAPVALTLLNGRDEAALLVESLAKGTHTITAAYTGDSSFAASSATSTLIETVKAVPPPVVDGPKVELVQRFGIHMQPTVVLLSFDEALDPTSAVNLSNYKITDPNGHTVRISSAVFDAKTNTVTLRPAERINLHHTYHLTIIGTGRNGVRNPQGLLLDGTDKGTPDSNYTCSIDWRNVVLTPAEIAKYVHPHHAKPAGALKHTFVHKSR
jgi:CSLREA domain-containing protein